MRGLFYNALLPETRSIQARVEDYIVSNPHLYDDNILSKAILLTCDRNGADAAFELLTSKSFYNRRERGLGVSEALRATSDDFGYVADCTGFSNPSSVQRSRVQVFEALDIGHHPLIAEASRAVGIMLQALLASTTDDQMFENVLRIDSVKHSFVPHSYVREIARNHWHLDKRTRKIVEAAVGLEGSFADLDRTRTKPEAPDSWEEYLTFVDQMAENQLLVLEALSISKKMNRALTALHEHLTIEALGQRA